MPLSSGFWLQGPGELHGDANGGEQALVAGDAAAGDIEGGAVVDRGADDREAEGDVDAAFEAVHLDGDVALVVILGDHDIELAPGSTPEDGVGGPGAGDLHVVGAGA